MARKRRPTDALTADAWDTASADLMIRYLRKHPPCGTPHWERQCRLIHSGFCRRHWAAMPDDLSRRAVEAAEQYADGATDFPALQAVNESHWERHRERCDSGAKRDHAFWLSAWASHASDPYSGHIQNGWNTAARALTAALVRDVFGNPFRPVSFAPVWRTAAALALARTMYDSRDFCAMPILADALEEAGCDHPDVLSHCRGPGPHVRGCWVVDLVLGKS